MPLEALLLLSSLPCWHILLGEDDIVAPLGHAVGNFPLSHYVSYLEQSWLFFKLSLNISSSVKLSLSQLSLPRGVNPLLLCTSTPHGECRFQVL